MARATLLQAWPEVNERPLVTWCGCDSVISLTDRTRRCGSVSLGRGRFTSILKSQSMIPSPMNRQAAIITRKSRPRNLPKIRVSTTAMASGYRNVSKSLTRAMTGSSHGLLHVWLIR